MGSYGGISAAQGSMARLRSDRLRRELVAGDPKSDGFSQRQWL